MRRHDRKSAGIAIQVEHAGAGGQPGDKGAVVALVVEPAGLLPGERHPPETRCRSPSSDTGPSTDPDATRLSSGSPSSVRAGLSLRSTIASGDSRALQRLEDERQQPVHAGGVGLHRQDAAEPVDHQPGQAVRLGMHQPVIGRAVQPLAQPQRPFEAAREKAAVDRRGWCRGRAGGRRSAGAG